MMELWKSVNEQYEVSSFGRVKKSGTIVNTYNVGYPDRLGNRYQCIWMGGKNTSIHSLVCEHFIYKKPEGLVVNHIDGNKGNNRLENLEYVTYSENTNHSFKNHLQIPKTKKVMCIEDGLSFDSVNEASKYYNTKPWNISKSISNGQRVKYKYTFKLLQ